MRKVWKRVVAATLTVSLISSFNISKITFAEEKSTNEIAIDASNFPDSIFQDYVKSNFDENKDGKLSDEEISNITYIYVNMKGIKDLKGIENFKNLECLYAEMNYIESLDLSQNKNLVVGYFDNNLIKSVKLPNDTSNDKLEVLSLLNNRLTEINLSNLDVLRYINLCDNRLTTLDLNVGKIESFTASYNELTEVKLPNSGVTYNWKDLLAKQLYHERTGYDYKWYYDANRTQEIDANTTPSIKFEGQTLYSEYIPIKYTVEFKSGDSNSASKVQNFVYDTAQNLLENDFTKEGYIFSGWKDNNGKIYSDGEEVKNLTSKKGENIILTATWTEQSHNEQEYVINFPNEKNLAPIQDIKYGVETELPKSQLEKEGYDFIGWSTKENGEVEYYDGGKVLITNPSEINGVEVDGVKTLNLYAVWKVKEFTVNFIDTQNTYKKVVKYNSKLEFPEVPNKEGYILSGWITEKGEVWSIEDLVTSDMNLYAQYSPIEYSVLFNGNGANNLDAMNNATINMDYSKQAVLPTNLYKKTGYTFKGWSTLQNGEVEFIDKAVIYQLTTENNKKITLYAVWEKVMSDSTITISTDSLDKTYDGKAVKNPTIEKTGSTNEVKLTWYEKVDSKWQVIKEAPVNVGTYKVVASVEGDENYKEASAEKEFKISKAVNSWTVEPSIEGWKVGENPKSPVGQSKFGKVEFTYSNSKDGEFTTVVPTETGTWYMKATVVGNENYDGLEVTLEFIIEKSEDKIEGDQTEGDGTSDDNTSKDEVIVSDVVISNGNNETNKFTYGDKIVIKFIVNDKTRAVKKVALFANNVQVSEAQDAVVGKELTFEYDTKKGLVDAKGDIELKLAYVDGNVVGKEIYKSVITLEKKSSDSKDIVIPEISENTNLDNLQIKDGDIILKQGVDYDITKTQNGDTVTVVITFKGNYSGAITKTYKIEIKEEPVKPLPGIKPQVEIRGGARRYETAVELSKSKFNSANTVVLAGGYALADGLTATPIATEYNAPLLLVEKNNIPEATKNEIKRLGAKNIIIVGGTTVITKEVESQLLSLGVTKITRLGGSDRYETSLLVAKYIDSNLYNIENIVVTNGLGEADAMSISPVSGRDRMPIILVRSTYIPSSVKSWLKEKSLKNAYVIGGTTAINDEVLKEINAMTSSDISGNRLGGSTRYETNALIINKFYENTTNKVYVSKGLQLIDALSSGPIAALENSPVVLAGNDLTATQRSILSKRTTNTIIQAGHGIPSNVIESLKDLLATK